MDIVTLTTFLGWSLTLNAGIYLFWISAWMLVPDWIYRSQAKLFKMSRATFEPVFYGFFAVYKLLILFFNAVPYLVLLIMQ